MFIVLILVVVFVNFCDTQYYDHRSLPRTGLFQYHLLVDGYPIPVGHRVVNTLHADATSCAMLCLSALRCLAVKVQENQQCELLLWQPTMGGKMSSLLEGYSWAKYRSIDTPGCSGWIIQMAGYDSMSPILYCDVELTWDQANQTCSKNNAALTELYEDEEHLLLDQLKPRFDMWLPNNFTSVPDGNMSCDFLDLRTGYIHKTSCTYRMGFACDLSGSIVYDYPADVASGFIE